MSNRSRLLLLSGPGGSGTTSTCAATAAALAAQGRRVEVVDASEPRTAHPAVLALIASTVGRVAGELGADPLPVATWSTLGIVGRLSALRSVLDALADPLIDVVIVDCGPISSARELVELPSTLVRLLDAALTPRAAMWRGAQEPEHGDTIFEALSSARGEVIRMQQALDHPDTAMRLVTTPDGGAVSRTLEAVGVLALLGIGVEGVLITGMAQDDDEDRRQLDRLRVGLGPVEAWTAGVRPEPLAAGPRLTEATMELTARGKQFALRLPLAGSAVASARVGRLGDDVVVEYGTARRWLALPPVLVRCRAVHADRGPAGLEVTFVPESGLWREPAESGR